MKINCDPDTLFGDPPKTGDKVYVDFGDSIYTGGEIVGEVGKITADEIVINRRVYRWAEIAHLEVIEDEA